MAIIGNIPYFQTNPFVHVSPSFCFLISQLPPLHARFKRPTNVNGVGWFLIWWSLDDSVKLNYIYIYKYITIYIYKYISTKHWNSSYKTKLWYIELSKCLFACLIDWWVVCLFVCFALLCFVLVCLFVCFRFVCSLFLCLLLFFKFFVFVFTLASWLFVSFATWLFSAS